jgi:hypothetical protein
LFGHEEPPVGLKSVKIKKRKSDGHDEQHYALKGQGLVPETVVYNFIFEPVPVDVGKYPRNDNPKDAASDKKKPSEDLGFELFLVHTLTRNDPHQGCCWACGIG